jgi:hypothetical protein
MSDAASRAATAAALFASRAIVVASWAARESVSARAGTAAMASGFGPNSAGFENSTADRYFEQPLRNPGSGPPCSAMPDHVMRSMFGIHARH